MKFLFVCTGNTCRSPMAEMYFNYKVGQDSLHYASSAGILAYDGSPLSDNAKKVLCHFHIPFNQFFKSRSIKQEDMRNNHYILTMEEYQSQLLKNQFVSCSKKISLLSHMIDKNDDVTDPFPHDMENYMKTFEQIKEYIDLFINKLSSVQRTSHERTL
ncbi:MAG: low molecular weight protein arginine phosphatase [Spirochaetes bacterium]|nr:low molecular weight protein arginine phosphatase [Spirochaetota bacterium]